MEKKMKKTSIIALLCCLNTVQSYQNRMKDYQNRMEKTTSTRTLSDGTVIRETIIKDTQDGVHKETYITEKIKPQAKPMGGDGSQTDCRTVSPGYHQACCAKIKNDGKEYNDQNQAFCAQFNDQDLEKELAQNQRANNDSNDYNIIGDEGIQILL
jgi:hypothetical protein